MNILNFLAFLFLLGFSFWVLDFNPSILTPKFKIKPSEKLSNLSFYPKLFLFTSSVLLIAAIGLFILFFVLANLFATVQDLHHPDERFYELLVEKKFWIFAGLMFLFLFVSIITPEILYHRILPDGVVKYLWLDLSKKAGLVRPWSKYPFGVSSWERENELKRHTVSQND